jgi:acetyl esterase
MPLARSPCAAQTERLNPERRETMPLDPQAKALIDMMKSAPSFSELTPTAARKQMNDMRALRNAAPVAVANVEDRKIPGPAGSIPVRVYTPAGKGPFPVLVFYHGGGFVIGDLESHDGLCRALTNGAGCVTVAVDYRLAPEAKFPAAVEDCYAATRWVSENAAQLNADANRLAVGGDSAGGNLSAVISIMARDAKSPKIMFQLLIYPATDITCSAPSHRTNTEYVLTPGDIRWFMGHYLRNDADIRNPQASPSFAASFNGLPPALIITAEFDPLRDEAEDYGQKLRAAGVAVQVSRYEGMVHGFVSMGDMLDKGKQGAAEAAAALKKAFGR